MSRFVILSGPSCAGKGPLHKAVKKFYPDLAEKLRKIVCYDSRAPRPGERDGVDYYFRTRKFIEQLRQKKDFTVTEVRGDLQAVDFNAIRTTLKEGDAFFEGNPFIAKLLLDFCKANNINNISIFLSPLSMNEINRLKSQDNMSLRDIVTDIMRRKLLRRTQRQKSILSAGDLKNIETRAASAYSELKLAHHFDYVIPNHDGEDSENWDAFYYPVGDAGRTLLAFTAILNGNSQGTENWSDDLLI
jgi:guanylate kinase